MFAVRRAPKFSAVNSQPSAKQDTAPRSSVQTICYSEMQNCEKRVILHLEAFALAFSGPHFITRTGKPLCMCEKAQHNNNRNGMTIIISVLEVVLPVAL